MDETRPFNSATSEEAQRDSDGTIRAIRFAFAFVSALLASYGTIQVLLGMFSWATTWQPAEYHDSESLPLNLPLRTADDIYRNSLIHSSIQITSGMLVGVLAFLTWTYRRRFSLSSSTPIDVYPIASRLAVFGLMVTCFGAFGTDLITVQVPMTLWFAIGQCLAFLVFLGFGLCCSGLFVGVKSGISFARGGGVYLLALAGVGISGYALFHLIDRSVQQFLWRWQMLG